VLREINPKIWKKTLIDTEPRFKLLSARPWFWVFLILVLIYILPIWVFKYFPSQDGPSHIYNSFILKHYHDSEYVFDKFYEIRKSPVPNWASYFIMVPLMYVVPPLIAEKILLTIYIALMALSMLYLVNSVEGGRTPLAFLCLPFIYNYLFLMGFYNYSLSVALLILVMGYWWKHYHSFGLKNMVILGLLLIALYFCHLVCLVLAMLSIALISIINLLPRFKKWKQTLLCLLCMLPAGGLTYYYTSTRGTVHSGSWTFGRMWQYFIRNESLAYHSESQLTIAWFITGAFLVLFFYTFIRDRFITRDWHFGLRVHMKDFLLILCVAFFIIYLKAPDGMSGGGFIKTRLSFLPFLIIIPWLSWDMPKVARAIVGIVLVTLAFIYIVRVGYYHRSLNEEIKEYNSGYDSVERNKVLLPLGFDYIGGSWRIGIFTHTPAYYGYERGCINLINYEAGTDYFTTFFKPEFNRPTIGEVHTQQTLIDFAKYKDNIDYILTWAMTPESGVEPRILDYYSLVKENGRLKIFKRKAPE